MFARTRTINTFAKVDAEHEQLIWTHPGMTTYYRNGQGRVFSAMPWRFVDYWAMTHDPDLRDYRQTKWPDICSRGNRRMTPIG